MKSWRDTGTVRLTMLLITVLLCAQSVQAHVNKREGVSFLSGLEHPLTGLDHVVAMIAVGLWGAQLGAPEDVRGGGVSGGPGGVGGIRRSGGGVAGTARAAGLRGSAGVRGASAAQAEGIRKL